MISKPKSKSKLKRKNKPAQKSKLNTKLIKSDSKILERSNIKTRKIIPNNIPSTFRPVPKPGGIKHNRQNERERNLQKLKLFLITNRAGGKCELPYCGSARNLQEHHIKERSVGGKDTTGNIIIACGNCHDHQKYVHGLPISPEEALFLVTQKNGECGISNFLTGDVVPNGGLVDA
jgi:hypothetical protein